MNKKIIGIMICMCFIVSVMPITITALNNDSASIIEPRDGKKIVRIIGDCGSYGFGGVMHIGRLWWCPNPDFSVDFGFFTEDLYVFRVNGKKYAYNEDSSQITISLVKFFGFAPTLINFVLIPPTTIYVYGICDEINIRELE